MSTRQPLSSWSYRSPEHLRRPLRYVTFGEVVARSRKKLGLNQTELAAEVSISRTYLSSIERDRADNLSIAILLRLARALDVDKCELLRIYAAQLEEIMQKKYEVDGHRSGDGGLVR